MKCFCKEKSYEFRVEVDYAGDPIWCDKCNCNLDLDEFSLSEELKYELRIWALTFDRLTFRKLQPEITTIFNKKHNKIGLLLTERVQNELGDEYTVDYRPAYYTYQGR